MERVLILFLLLIFSNIHGEETDSLFRGEVTVKALLDKTQLPLNDSVRLDFEIQVNGNYHSIELFDPPIPGLSNLKIIGSGASSKVTKEGLIKSCYYYLKPESKGMAYIEPIKTGYEELTSGKKSHLSTKRLSVEIIEAEKKETTSFSFAYILLFLIILLGGIAILIIKKKSSREDEEKEKVLSELGPREIALTNINELMKEKSDNKEKLIEVNQIVINYFRREFDLPSGISGRGIVKRLSEMGYKDSELFEIQDYFDQCDLLKFSGSRIEQKDVDDLIYKSKEILKMKLTKNSGGDYE